MATIEKFRKFLNCAWPELIGVLKGHDWDDDIYFVEDWVDANWQLLVGRQLLGPGRSIQPFAAATNDILRGRFDYWFESVPDRHVFVLLGAHGKCFELAPPFDHVMVMNPDGSTEIIKWLSVEFNLRMRETSSAL